MIECVARAVYETRQDAEPVVRLTVTAEQAAIVIPASLNAIVPPVGTGATVAVKLTLRPTPIGFCAETIVVTVVAPLTC